MDKFKKILILFFCIIFTLSSFSLEDNSFKGINVVIIYEKSNYKNALVNKLGKELVKKGIIIKKDVLSNINNYNPNDYDAVIILSSVTIFTPRVSATMYIKKNNYKKNIIYFCSTEYKEAAYGFLDQEKIDAITAASNKNNIEEISKEILDRLFSILAQYGK